MKLFQKEEPDMICWNCDYFFNHKKVDWKPRKLSVDYIMKDTDTSTEDMKLLREVTSKDPLASSNKIFGASEYEYRGQCPKCKESQTCFWFGKQSVSKNKNISIEKKEIVCGNCQYVADRAFQVWYSIRMKKESEITEFLVTICPKCSAEQAYPYEYNLETGVID